MFGSAELDQFPPIHHSHFIGDLGDDAQIVGDEQNGVPRSSLSLRQVEYLSLNCDVESRGRLIGDEQLGIAAKPWRS